MTRRIKLPSDKALTDDLRPLADAVVTAWTATDEASKAVEHLADKNLDKRAKAVDDEAIRTTLEAGKTPSGNLITKAADKLAADRRVAAVTLDLAEAEESQATRRFNTAMNASTNALIDHAQARAEAEAEAYRVALTTFLSARGEYVSAVRDLDDAWTRHLDVEHKALTPTVGRTRRPNDPGPRTDFDLMAHPTLPYELRPAYMKEILERDAQRHEFPDPRE